MTVFGAGITGLAAAHELIERGFIVQLLEPTKSPDHYGHVKIGGMAASQYSHIPLPGHDPGGMMRRARRLYGTPEKIYFAPDGTDYQPNLVLAERFIANDWQEPPNSEKLEAVATTLAAAAEAYAAEGERLRVQIIGHTDDARSGDDARALAQSRAEDVERHLLAELRRLGAHPIIFEIVALGSAEPFGDNAHPAGRARNNRVEFEIEELRLPGEHGYRFYPAFY
ncbi:MAG: OmpA family protein, partial [Myxococcota bacterium]